MTTPSRLTQIHGSLAAAVISQAVRDATRQMGSAKKSATTWLLQNDDGFRFWCIVLAMDPDQTRQELSDLLDARKNNAKLSLWASQQQRTAEPANSDKS